jgi:Fe-S-cluster-containing dehydrogenase component
MSNYNKYLFYNADLCIGCHACEVACKMEHALPAGVNRVKIMKSGPVLANGNLKIQYQRMGCRHCVDSPCTETCPSKAIHKRPDGIVSVKQSLCIGCRSCAGVCPYEAVDFLPNNQLAQICDLCCERLDEGKLPFCLKHCMSGALFFGTQKEFENTKSNIPIAKGKCIE